jgi:hypothetical protein
MHVFNFINLRAVPAHLGRSAEVGPLTLRLALRHRRGRRRFAGGGGRGGAVAHASLISRGIGPLLCRLALRDGATTMTMATA